MSTSLDTLQLNFSPAAALGLQAILAIVIYGVALELSWGDFRRLLRQPKPVLVGLVSQLMLLPLLTFGLVVVLQPHPSIALGLMMTAACPGGNTSNLLTHWSGGRTSVSMTLTAVSSLISPLTTPLTFQLLAQFHAPTEATLRTVQVPIMELVMTIGIALVVPLLLGMWTAEKFPAFTARVRRPLKQFGVLVLVAFIVLALAANFKIFFEVLGMIFGMVLLHNALSLACGYSVGRIGKLHETERRALTFETGIHNTALGLTLAFSFYQGLGGMTLVMAWWGVWQLITGCLLARYWATRGQSHAAA